MKKKIAIFTTGWGSEILSQFLKGMIASLKDERVDLFLFTCYPTYIDTAPVKKGELNIFTLPDLNDFDGVVIFCSGLGFDEEIDKIIERAKKAGVPIILQGGKREGLSYIGSDNYYATKSMCDHLYNEHHIKSIVFIAGSKDSLDSELRLKAVKDYLEEKGDSDSLLDVYYTRWENAAADRYITRYIEEKKPFPDAFICANDGLAMQTCTTLFENGYEVPRDVLVTGYDYIDDGQIFDPSIASVDQCFSKMGEACGSLWLDLISGKTECESVVIPCEFIPGESCNCYEFRNSDQIRRRMGRENFSKRAMTTYFERKLNIIDSTILPCLTHLEFKENLYSLLVENHDYEGDSFHVLLEPNFGLSIYDADVKLNTDRYSKNMEVIYSTEDGVPFREELFKSRDLIPGYDPEGPNHLYVFLPLHEADLAYGYIIFRDCIDKVENHFLLTYANRMGLAFEKFRHALTLDHINKRLVDLMGRDPLTNVNNRMAYEDKENLLQSQINTEPDLEFAIAMFDVNNLKMINDSQGHEAGDAYLIRACRLICDVFKHSPVYRIGGDEFVAVMTGEDYKKRDKNVKALNKKMSKYSDTLPLPEDYVSVACGVAVFDAENDVSVADVIKRADEEMYKDKAAKKTKPEE